MAQFDLFVNPIASIRRAYPLVVVLQSNFAPDARHQVVAPLVPLESTTKVAGRLTPIIAVGGSNYAVHVHALTGMPVRDLKDSRGTLVSARHDLLAAIDYLFFGV